MKMILVLALLLGTLLSYGYWQVVNHGYLYLSLYQDQQFTSLTGAELRLLDHTGRQLAAGKTDDRSGVTHLRHPELGYCSEQEQLAAFSKQSRKAWQVCFRAQSRWLVGWIEDFSLLSVHIDDCQLDRIPVTVKKDRYDWWLWWVPHPHIGGKPYTGYSASLRIDPSACTATATSN